MLKILAIETATAACSAALQIGGEVSQKRQIAPQKHAELILPMINDLLSEAGISLGQLNAIAFGCGPGSFMGVRIATGIAQGLAFGADLPMIPVSTLQALAQGAYEQALIKNCLVAWDARMQALYWGAYQLDSFQIMQSIQPDQLSPPEEICLPNFADWAAVGNGWHAYQKNLNSQLTDGRVLIQDIYPEAVMVAKIGKFLYQAGKVIDPLQAKPVYLREKVTN